MVVGLPQAEEPEPRRRTGLMLIAVGTSLAAALAAWLLLRGPEGTSYGDTNELVAAMQDAGVACHWEPLGGESDDALGNLDPETTACWVGDSWQEIIVEARMDRSEVESALRVLREDGSTMGQRMLVAGPDWLLEIPRRTLPEDEARRLAESLGATDVVPVRASDEA